MRRDVAQLVRIVEHCGRHALTVDHIKEYGDPAATRNLGATGELKTKKLIG